MEYNSPAPTGRPKDHASHRLGDVIERVVWKKHGKGVEMHIARTFAWSGREDRALTVDVRTRRFELMCMKPLPGTAGTILLPSRTTSDVRDAILHVWEGALLVATGVPEEEELVPSTDDFWVWRRRRNLCGAV